MRVLHLDTGEDLRGGQRQMLLLQAGLARRDYEQTVLARGEALRRSGGERATPWALVRSARKADLIHAHDARAHSWAAFLCPGTPLIVSRRVAFPPRSDALSRRKYSRPRRFLAVSNYVGFKLKAAGVPADRIDLVPDGISLSPYQQAFRRPTSSPRVLAVASSDPLKLGETAITACQLAKLDLRFARDLDSEIEDADVFLYLSESEGLGSAILFAASRKIPVVASAEGGIPEIVRDGVTGLLTQNSAADAADALRRFAADPELARQCAERAYEQVKEKYRDDIMFDRTEHSYRLALGLDS